VLANVQGVGFFMYLREMRRWFTLAGVALVLVGGFGHVRPIAFVGLALIALQVVIMIWAGVKEARAGFVARAPKEPTRPSGGPDQD
jgi:hypothetical protein